MTTIEWTDATWNPVTGCTKVSPGCAHCYAETVAHRFWKGRAFTDVQCHEDRLDQPLRWRKPRRVFVNSMSDLFHEDVSDEFIDLVFAVMAMANKHTFQVLTKRAERMVRWFQDSGMDAVQHTTHYPQFDKWRHSPILGQWPLRNVWLGVSVENQTTAGERIPLLLQTPAAVRFLSCEPLLEEINLRLPTRTYPDTYRGPRGLGCNHCCNGDRCDEPSHYERRRCPHCRGTGNGRPVDWVIVGGESGSQARPCDVAWVRSIVRQCRDTSVPCFVKQFGSNVRDRNDAGFDADSHVWAEGPDAGCPVTPGAWPDAIAEEGRVEHHPNGYREDYQGAPVRVRLHDRKGGDMSEWPVDLRVREWPTDAQTRA